MGIRYVKEEKMEDKDIKRLAEQLEKASEFTHSPWRIILFNFIAGVARGFGFALGTTLIVAVAVYFISKLINIPIIGYWVAEIVKIATVYLKQPIPGMQ